MACIGGERRYAAESKLRRKVLADAESYIRAKRETEKEREEKQRSPR